MTICINPYESVFVSADTYWDVLVWLSVGLVMCDYTITLSMFSPISDDVLKKFICLILVFYDGTSVVGSTPIVLGVEFMNRLVNKKSSEDS